MRLCVQRCENTAFKVCDGLLSGSQHPCECKVGDWRDVGVVSVLAHQLSGLMCED